jgi:hypothetical protein
VIKLTPTDITAKENEAQEDHLFYRGKTQHDEGK